MSKFWNFIFTSYIKLLVLTKQVRNINIEGMIYFGLFTSRFICSGISENGAAFLFPFSYCDGPNSIITSKIRDCIFVQPNSSASNWTIPGTLKVEAFYFSKTSERKTLYCVKKVTTGVWKLTTAKT